MVLGRSLMGLHGMIDSAVAEVRMSVDRPGHERIALSQFIDEAAMIASQTWPLLHQNAPRLSSRGLAIDSRTHAARQH